MLLSTLNDVKESASRYLNNVKGQDACGSDSGKGSADGLAAAGQGGPGRAHAAQAGRRTTCAGPSVVLAFQEQAGVAGRDGDLCAHRRHRGNAAGAKGG